MSEIICGVYIIYNVISGRKYVGSSKDIFTRLCQHFIDLKRNDHGNPHLQNAFNKYGLGAFEYDILVECKSDDLLVEEQRFIDSMNPEYNISKIAGKVEFTPEVRRKCGLATKIRMMGNQYNKGRKMSESNICKLRIRLTGNEYGKGHKCHTQPHSEEAKQKISKANMGNQYRKGKHLLEEAKQKISKAHIGIHHSDETKQKLSKALMGNQCAKGHHNKMSYESRQKISKAQKGKHMSEEAKQKISIAMKGKHNTLGYMHTEESKQKMSIAHKLYEAGIKLNG